MTLIVYLTVMVLYVIFTLTSCPTVFLGDSGEIITAAAALGVCHPPGYPLYMMLAKISTLMPAGDAAFRVNLLAAALGAAAFAPVFMLCREFLFFTGDKQEKKHVTQAAAYAASLAFTLHSGFWQLCTQAKGGIYVLAVIITSLSLYWSLRFLRLGKTKHMYLALYLAGFLPFIHQSASAYALLSALICVHGSWKAKKRLIPAAGFLLLSLLTANLYLFIRNAGTSAAAWNGVEGIKDLLGHIFRSPYLAAAPGDFSFMAYIKRLWLFLLDLARSFTILAVFFGAGVFFAVKRKTRGIFAAAFYIITVFLFLAGSNNMSGFEQNSVSENSMQVARQMAPLVNLLFILTACYGFSVFMAGLNTKANYSAAAVIGIGFLAAGFNANDCSKMFLGYDHALNILNTGGSDGRMFLTEDTYSFNTLYVIKNIKRYAAYPVHDRQANILNREFYAEALKNSKGRQMRLVNKRLAELSELQKHPGSVYYSVYENFSKEGYTTAAAGILFCVFETGKNTGKNSVYRTYSLRDYFRNKNLNIHYRDIIGRYFMMNGWQELDAGNKTAAARHFSIAESIAPDSTTLLSQIASAYLYAAGDSREAARYMEKTLILDPYSKNIKKSLAMLRMDHTNPALKKPAY